MKRLKKVLVMTLTLTMVFSSFTLLNHVNAEETAKNYTIYPTPHEVVYGSDEFSITNNVNVVYGDAIDSFTKNHLDDVLAILDKTPTITEAVADGKTNVIVGVYGSGDYVDTYFKNNNLIDDENLFSKYDSYVLSVKDGIIAVLGKDTDAAFNGITSLKHVFNQVQNNSILEFTINDYADIKARGFIEGYYGNPWSNEDRADLMTFGGDYKLNQYIYAPKDDPKHNSKWKELYTAEELEEIKKLAEAGNRSKCYYVYALHPFMYNAIRFGSDEAYQEDLNIIKTKFEQLMDAGVKQFSILADDAGMPSQGPQTYVRLMKDLTDWLIEKQATVEGLKSDTIFCPNDYMGWGTSEQMQALKALPDSVSIIQTGGRVWGEVGPNFNNSFYNSMGRPAYMWINWPCSDNTKDGLIMGGAETVLKPNVDAHKVDGIVLNPMQQSEPSKQGLFTNADYAWNIWEDASEYDKVWHDSFSFVDHGTIDETPASIALRELSKHMMNSQQLGNEESIELKAKLSSFISDLNAGNDILEKADDLIAEFKLLQDSAKTYSENPGNERTKGQIIYWLDCWQDTTEAVINYLNAAKALQNEEENDVIWDYFANGQAAFDRSRTHGFHYVDHTEYAKVGRRYIYPFMQNLDNILSTRVSGIVDPTKEEIRFITNRSDTPTGETKNVLDNNAGTEIIFKSPTTIDEGTYVGISSTKGLDVNEVTFRLGQSGNLNDTFSKAKIQYTIDGKEWLDLNDEEYELPQEVNLTGLDLHGVKGIRMIATADKGNTWLGVRDIVINGQGIEEGSSDKYSATVYKSDRYGIYSNYNVGNLIDDSDDSFVWFNQNAQVDDYVGLDLGKVERLGVVRFIMGNGGNDYWNTYDLEYSVDGNTYTKVASYSQNVEKKTVEVDLTGIQARYVRVRNTQDKGVWLKMSDFRVNRPSDTFVDTNSEALKNIATTVDSAVSSIKPTEGIVLNPNEYIGITLLRIKDLSNIDLQLTNGENLTLQVSKNKVDWVDVDPASQDLPDARYVRLINLTNTPITFNLDKFEVNSNELSGPVLHDSTIGINGSWGVDEDCRENGAAFDGNVDTITEFADLPQEGQYIIYDLGQERNISKIEMYCQDSAVNYLRDADILISNDLENWTKVVTIGDGIENKNDANISCINSDAGYKASSTYPNKVYVEGTVDTMPARYLKILVTATNNNRAVVFNEIVINDGEYVPVSNDPTFTSNVIEVQGFVPQNMIDGNLATAYKPNTTEAGYITYTLSDNLDVKKLNIIQKGEISNAKVMALVDGENGREWIQVGSLSKSLNEIYLPFDKTYELKIEWEANKIPTISEIVVLNDDEFLPEIDALQKYVDSLDVDESAYTASSYKKFADKLKQAEEVLTTAAGDKKLISQAYRELQIAYTNLITRGDGQLIKDELDKINALKADDYTEATWSALQEKVVAANELLDKATDELTAKEVADMVNELQVAKSNLITKVAVSKEGLQNYIDNNDLDQLDTTKYLTSTAEPFEAALQAAHDLIASDDATVEDLENALTTLQEARAALILKAADDEVKALEGLVANYQETDYTASSWKEFAAVLNEVEEALKGENSSEDIVKLTNDLTKAAKNLVARGDLTDLNILLETAKVLDKNKYTEESYQQLLAVIADIEKALEDSSDMVQTDVDALQEKLQDAIDALKVKPSVTPTPSDPSSPTGTVVPGTTTSTKTGDNAAIGTFIGLAMLSVAGLWIYRKKENC